MSPSSASLLLAILLVPAAALAAAAVEDFEAPLECSLFKAAERGAVCAREAVPGGGQALVLRWAATHAAFHEIYFATPRPLPGAGTLVLRARLTGQVPAWTLSARVRDAKGEMFDYHVTVQLGEGWSEVRIPVVDDGKQAHWGGNPGTGRHQGALALAGLAVNVGDGIGTGELWIDDLTCEPAKP